MEIDPKAVARVLNPLPKPTTCRYCGGPVDLVHNSVVYSGQAYGDWPYVYACADRECNSYVGVHPRTDIPLGTLANAQLRQARRAAKEAFNPLWVGMAGMRAKSVANKARRTAAYTWLAGELGIPVEQCHIAWFDIDMCYATVVACKEKK